MLKNSESEDFLSSIVHELKTPINAIAGFSEILEDEIRNPGHARECAYYAKEINNASVELLGIVHDLLDIGVAGAANFSVDLSHKINVVEVVRRAMRLNWDYSLRRRINLKLNVAGRELDVKQVTHSNNPSELDALISPINLDLKRTKQILTNLISNAIKYSPERSKVVISVAELDVKDGVNDALKPTKVLEIKVSDRGFGMTEEQISNLFGRYTTFPNPNSGVVDSTGLGLSITKNLIELQNGQISVDSKLNEGTEVTLKFPYLM